jgi:hypothetical protein
MPDPVEFQPKFRRRSVHRRRGLYGILIPRDLPGRPEVTRTVRSAGGGRPGPLPSPVSEKYLAANSLDEILAGKDQAGNAADR